MYMDDFVQQLYTILSSTGEALLNGAGSVSHLKCAMYLFLGYLDGATQFARSCGGGGSSNKCFVR